MRARVLTATFCALAASCARAQGVDEATYPDVPRGHWSRAAIDRLNKAGIVEGLPDGRFRGDRAMTRYEFAVSMARAFARGSAWGFGGDEASAFPDVPKGHWASVALSRASRFGLFRGQPSGRFSGNHTMTRYEGAAVFSRALSLRWEAQFSTLHQNPEQVPEARPEPTIAPALAAPFPNVVAGHWGHPAVQKVTQNGLFEGLPDDKFHGARPLSRYEFAVIAARLSEYTPPLYD